MQGDNHGSPICSSGLLTTIWCVLQIIQHPDISHTQENKKIEVVFLRQTITAQYLETGKA